MVLEEQAGRRAAVRLAALGVAMVEQEPYSHLRRAVRRRARAVVEGGGLTSKSVVPVESTAAGERARVLMVLASRPAVTDARVLS